jgi:hypothetical protein
MPPRKAPRTPATTSPSLLDSIALPLGIVMLVVWAIGVFALDGPGWLHLLLTLGVYFVIHGTVTRGTGGRVGKRTAE